MKPALPISVLTTCLSLLLFCTSVTARSNAVVGSQNTVGTLGAYMEFLVDTAGTMTLDQVVSAEDASVDPDSPNAWQTVDGENIIGGFTEAVYWVRFSVENDSMVIQPWVLEVDYAILDSIELYTPIGNNQYEKTAAGDKLPFQERPIDYRNVAFPIKTPAASTSTYYLRVQTESSMYIALNMWPDNTFAESSDAKLIVFGFIYGIVFLASIYCVMNAVFLRERSYVFIAFGILAALGYLLGLNGFGFQFFWSENLWLQSVSIPFLLNICFGFSLLYSREFLDLKSASQFSDQIIFGFACFCLFLAMLSLFMRYGNVIRISTVFAIVTAVAAFWAGAISFLRGNKSARFYLVGWMGMIIGAVMFALKSLGMLPSNLFTVWAQEFGFASIAVFITIAQSDRFFQAHRKHEVEQSSSLNAIKNAEKKYRSLFENAIEGIFQMDLDGRLVNANRAFAGILGSTDVPALLAQTHSPFSVCCLHENEQDKFKALLEKNNGTTTFETNVELPSGETRWVLINIQKIKNKYDVATHYEGAMADITESKKRQKAEKQQRMAEASTEAKSLFLANMSHEIRTPMNAIIGFTDLALGRNKDIQLADFLTKIRLASNNLLGIINDILDFSKIEAGKLEIEQTPFSLKEVLSNLENIVSVNIESKKLKLTIDVDEDIPDALIGDPLRIGQILLNLTNNAIKFTSKGEVKVEVMLNALNKKDLTIYLNGRITDTGIGIAPEKLKALFSSFTQADDSTTRRFGGTGLGLSISKQLVEMMGGKLTVSSTVNEGSTFEFTLACRLQDRRKMSNPHFSNFSQSPLNVLVVDDQQSSRELLEKALISLAHNVKSVTSSDEALIELQNKTHGGDDYDVLIADWLMPDIDGITCCQLAIDHPDITTPRMIVVTGYDQDGAREKAEQIGIDAYMLKPVKVDALSDTLQRLFQDRRTQRQNESPASDTVDEFNFNGLKLLLVEDVVMNQDLALEILSRKGIDVSVVADGSEAVDAVRTNDYDLVLMDMQMPVMDGCQATEVIREFDRKLPIIAMTANAMTGDRDRCLASGMNDYVTKPINPDALFEAISRWAKSSQVRPLDSAMQPQEDVNENEHERNIAEQEDRTLPERLPGVEIHEGLKRCQDNLELYLRFFEDFKRDYQHSAASLQSMVDDNETASIKLLAHTIKGLAGNLAAKPLAEVAAELEQAATMPASDLVSIIARFDSELNTFLMSIDEILTIHRVDKSSDATSSRANFTLSELADRVQQLAELIKAQKLEAHDLAVEYRQCWPIPDQLVQLEAIADALDLFDFELAKKLAEDLGNSIN